MSNELIDKVHGLIMRQSEDTYSITDSQAKEFIDLCQQDFKEQKSQAELNIGKWLLAALDDDSVCAQMKLDIVNWFTFIEDKK